MINIKVIQNWKVENILCGGLLVSVPATPPLLGSNLGPGPLHRAVWGAADHTVNTVQKNTKKQTQGPDWLYVEKTIMFYWVFWPPYLPGRPSIAVHMWGARRIKNNTQITHHVHVLVQNLYIGRRGGVRRLDWVECVHHNRNYHWLKVSHNIFQCFCIFYKQDMSGLVQCIFTV